MFYFDDQEIKNLFFNVGSERELMQAVPERLDWLWFLCYDIDNEKSVGEKDSVISFYILK